MPDSLWNAEFRTLDFFPVLVQPIWDSPDEVPVLKTDDVPVWGLPLDNAVEQMARCAADAEYAALMADHHLGYAVPIGGVLAYRDKVSPSAVGFDIACGNKAICLDVDAREVQAHIAEIMDEIFAVISFGIGRKNPEPVDAELFAAATWDDIPVAGSLKDMAHAQLGTVGSGNHYVDLFIDDRDAVWSTLARAGWVTNWRRILSRPVAVRTGCTWLRYSSIWVANWVSSTGRVWNWLESMPMPEEIGSAIESRRSLAAAS